MLNSESIVIIWIKGAHLLYSKISGGMIGYGWGNVCYIVNFSPGELLLYNKVSGGKLYCIANIPRGKVCYAEGLLYDTGNKINTLYWSVENSIPKKNDRSLEGDCSIV